MHSSKPLTLYKHHHTIHVKSPLRNSTLCGLRITSDWKQETRPNMLLMGGTCLRCHRTHLFRQLRQQATPQNSNDPETWDHLADQLDNLFLALLEHPAFRSPISSFLTLLICLLESSNAQQ